ncbi:hypothetical protein SADUNF_Sadunf16G0246800 [Salix dunnii]|uniref:Dynamin N-terminal domain-containing protein n=1 Tax=Salix dunnii TaxID=1413687 RepID=A0A835JC02_9ROSI|nr:hypothetical protein SADUNF_Sadunf16G0246800 [Salix dunnii]
MQNIKEKELIVGLPTLEDHIPICHAYQYATILIMSLSSLDGLLDEECFNKEDVEEDRLGFSEDDLKMTPSSPSPVTTIPPLISTKERLSYTRALVEMDLLADIRASIDVVLPNGHSTRACLKSHANVKLVKKEISKNVAATTTGSGKSTLLNSVIGHPVLPTSENGVTWALIRIDLQRDGSMSSKSILL